MLFKSSSQAGDLVCTHPIHNASFPSFLGCWKFFLLLIYINLPGASITNSSSCLGIKVEQVTIPGLRRQWPPPTIYKAK